MQSIGIDVSKKKLDIAWLQDPDNEKVKPKVFPNDSKGFQALDRWIQTHVKMQPSQVRVVMEATGIYHENLAYALHDKGYIVCVVNPAQIHDFRKSLAIRHKNDRKDSCAIVKFAHAIAPLAWVPEPTEIRLLKALLARIEALEADIQREENRLEKALSTETSDIVITSITSVISMLNAERQKLEQQIDDHFDQYPDLKKDRALLETIPGIGPVVSRMMVSVIRSRTFDNARQCAAFAGLIPVCYESGSSVRGRPRLSKAGNPLIRKKLYMAAIVASQFNPDTKSLYQRMVKAGKKPMSALGAVMRKLVHICFGVLKNQTKYQPQGAL